MLTAIPPRSRKITRTERTGEGILLYSEHEMIRVQVKTPEIVRVTATPAKEFSGKVRPGVICEEICNDITFTEEENRYVIMTGKMSLRIRKDTGSIGFYDEAGEVLLTEEPKAPHTFEEFETYTLAGAEQKTRKVKTADGEKDVLEEPLKIPTGKSNHIRLDLKLGEEALYGFGQHELTTGSLRGKTLYLQQANRQIAVPFVISTKGYGLLVDTYSPMIFRDEENISHIYVEADQELDYYVMCGGMNGAIKNYRVLTGKAAMLPKWAFGYVQSQERFETEEEILDVARRSREEGIGTDCIVLDWFSWGDNLWGQKSYDESRFPDPAAMIQKLHEEHIHFMISIWPAMGELTEDRKEFLENDLLLPACNVYNAFREEGRDLYWKQLERTHFSYGTDAWWCDSSEPFTPEWNHRERQEPAKLYEEYLSEAGLRMPYEYCNSYALYHAMGIYENQRKSMEQNGTFEKRVCNLTRSAFTGQQRYGTIMWSGDTAANWETLRAQITAGLHFSASGLPYWTTDIGAFFVKPGNAWYWDGRYEDPLENKGYAELFVRWYQLGCFLPVFRGHGTDCRRELWNFKGEFRDALMKANRLRYRLLPYIYSEAGKVWLDDASMIRWLAMDFSSDPETRDITDQYLFGEALMVCPVTEPMYYDESGEALSETGKTRKVYFPKGCDWYDLETKELYHGGTTAEVSAALDEILVFVKAGSLIPVCEPALSTEELGEVSFEKYGEGPCRYRFYTDAGDGYGYERGKYTIKVLE